ncbi:MAG TPA: DUF5995 family protein [Chloroflexota bacterium]|nr:DUF5995 family protein [Chloroflexota bacterium]
MASTLAFPQPVTPAPRLESFRPAETIDEVIDRLDAVIARARRDQHRGGYFAVLYRNVTARVKDGIRRGEFEDGARMERLDVVFANRYLEALHQFRAGDSPSKCWQASFEAAGTWRPIVLQHLLLGINAHINLDLGVAAAAVCPRDALGGLRKDFDAINMVLCVMLDEVQDRLARVWPMMTLLDRIGCRTDEAVMNFAIMRSREVAWAVATALAPLEGEEASRELARIDGRAALLARFIRCPGLTMSAAALLVRATELRQVPKIIDVLG